MVNGIIVAMTDAEVTARNAEIAAADADEAANGYKRKRAVEYPSIGDQLDMIYHNGDGGATFQAAIKVIKDKYPKG